MIKHCTTCTTIILTIAQTIKIVLKGNARSLNKLMRLHFLYYHIRCSFCVVNSRKQRTPDRRTAHILVAIEVLPRASNIQPLYVSSSLSAVRIRNMPASQVRVANTRQLMYVFCGSYILRMLEKQNNDSTIKTYNVTFNIRHFEEFAQTVTTNERTI